jgi:sugar lactone lactonase YvrE
MKIETITNQLCKLGEGPVWDAARNEIYWIDIINGMIHQYAMNDGSSKAYNVNAMIGCLAICKNGELLLALENGFGFLDRSSGHLRMSHDPESHLSTNRFNDGKCDVEGRLWAGTMAIDESLGAGSVYVFHDSQSRKKIENVSISNGIAWNADNTKMYFIDTPTFEVVSYSFDKTTAAIEDKNVIIHIPRTDGYPDGMTIDKEGMLWIAHWGGWQITRWNPNTGKKLCHISLPVSRVTSCTFGGTDLKDLFITSARVGLTDDELQKQPLAGSLFVIRNCGFEGLPAFEFNNLD